jgi:hypothetical protein
MSGAEISKNVHQSGVVGGWTWSGVQGDTTTVRGKQYRKHWSGVVGGESWPVCRARWHDSQDDKCDWSGVVWGLI